LIFHLFCWALRRESVFRRLLCRIDPQLTFPGELRNSTLPNA
jgi:hypothetical protein